MHILQRLQRLPFVRNLSGAFVGAVIALVLYGVYNIGATAVAALIPDTSREEHAAQKARDDKLIETALRAKKIAEELH